MSLILAKTICCQDEHLEIQLFQHWFHGIQEIRIIQNDAVLSIDGYLFYAEFTIVMARSKINEMKKMDKSRTCLFYEDEGSVVDIELRKNENGYSLVDLLEKTEIFIHDIDNLDIMFKKVLEYLNCERLQARKTKIDDDDDYADDA